MGKSTSFYSFQLSQNLQFYAVVGATTNQPQPLLAYLCVYLCTYIRCHCPNNCSIGTWLVSWRKTRVLECLPRIHMQLVLPCLNLLCQGIARKPCSVLHSTLLCQRRDAFSNYCTSQHVDGVNIYILHVIPLYCAVPCIAGTRGPCTVPTWRLLLLYERVIVFMTTLCYGKVRVAISQKSILKCNYNL